MPIENDQFKAKGGVVVGASEAAVAELEGGKLKTAQIPSSVAASVTGAAFPKVEVAGITDRQMERYQASSGHFIYRDPYFLDPMDFGAVADDNSHPLSGVYSTLAEAQTVYPFVTSLTQERDWAAIELAYSTLPSGENKQLNPPVGGGVGINYRIKGGGTIKLGNRKYYIGTSSIEATANSNLDATGASIHYTGTKDAFVRRGNSPFAFWRCNCKGLTLYSDYTEEAPASGGRHGVNMLRLSDSVWENVLIYGFRDDGFVIPGGQWNQLIQVNSIYNGGYGFRCSDGVELETELTAEITATETTLPVAATIEVTTGLEARIGSYYGEEITYTGKTSTSLTGCTRGVNESRKRSWPSGTKIFIMQAQSANNNNLIRCRGEVNGRGGWFCDRGHANTAPGSTMQFSGRETKLTEEANVPGELTVRSVLKVESTEGWAPSGTGMLTGSTESEIFTYEGKTATEFTGVMRGMRGYAASKHTIAGTAVRQGIGVHFRGGENMANTYYGHLEGNTWHSFVEAYNVSEEVGMPRGAEIIAFFVSSNKCERYLVDHGENTNVAGASQANIEANLTRNGTKIPFEIYWTNAKGGSHLSIGSFSKITAPSKQQLVTDQTGLSLEEGYEGRGFYSGGPLFLGKYNDPEIWARISNGANRKIVGLGNSNQVQFGSTQQTLLLQGTEINLGKTGEKVAMYGATPISRPAAIGNMTTTTPTNITPYGFTLAQAEQIITKLNGVIETLKNFGITE